ncbi:MAG TPA: hypothetical protein ENK11_10125, partial [Phycisphaerales bacterium]|nr:hypothetical protein [Phycisphaerales bacterium]
TLFELLPVRGLSMADDGTMAFSWHGDIYTLRPGRNPSRLDITIAVDGPGGEPENVTKRGGASEFAVSPGGKEVAFVVRGEVFVTSVEFGTTRRITDTPEQERSVSFSPDGRSLIYAGERDGSWNVYESSLVDDDELYFFSATKIEEKPVVATDADEFQPAYSPDGEKVAYLFERNEIRVFDTETGETATALPGDKFYSYEDGDLWYDWSPDGRWIATQFYSRGRIFYTEVGLVPADGEGDFIELSNSGYDDMRPRFAMEGGAVIWMTDRYGMRAQGSWGAENDVVAAFLTQDAYDRFRLSKEEYELRKELEEKKKDADKDDGGDDEKAESDDAGEMEADADEEDNDTDEETDEDEDADGVEPIEIEREGLDERRARLTPNASLLGGFAMSPEGDKIYYLAKFEKGFDLWTHDFRESSTKILAKLGASSASMEMSDDGGAIFLLADGSLSKIDANSGERKGISFAAGMTVDRAAERGSLLGHVWRQTLKKFYRPDMHGVDWSYYLGQYRPKLADVTNNRDFAVILSEMLGELNASHTGGIYRPGHKDGDDSTASLGVIYDNTYAGPGAR